jgi:hypothetical protein
MKNLRLLGAAVVPMLALSGCSSMSNTDKGVLGGGAIGAGTGAIIGNATGHAGTGALIGAGVGALTGGLIGHAEDKQEKEAQDAAAAAQAARQIPMPDIVQMTQQHISDGVIINQIRASGSVYQLSAQDTIWLKQNGVSDAVVTEMMATAQRYPRRVYTAVPVYGEPVIVAEPPPPPVTVGVGVGLRGRF